MRNPDLLWEAMIEVLGLHAPGMTASERGRINRALMELREVNATPEQLRDRADEYRRRWPTMSVTASALAGNWSSLAVSHVAVQDQDRYSAQAAAERTRKLILRKAV